MGKLTLVFFLLFVGSVCADGAGSDAILPSAQTPPTLEEPKVQWAPLFKESLYFLGMQHAFRFATEPGTRDGVRRMSFRDYRSSIGNLHGWSDGDPFYVNYIGHPMQGAVLGYIWAQNDPRFKRVEFGKDPRYWKGRLRAAAYSFAYSEQFEIGPVSEASIGHIQKLYPQQGFVDHVVTPVIGVGWMTAEDAIDRFLVKRFENRVTNRWVRLFVRSGSNPAHSMANAIVGKYPWHRDSREGVETYRSGMPGLATPKSALVSEAAPDVGVAPFEFTTQANILEFEGSGACAGGGASAAVRVTSTLQIVADVSGCKFLSTPDNHSGDSLTYLIGPRWTPSPNRRVVPHFELLVGGHKMTTEELFPDLKRELEASGRLKGIDDYDAHGLYARHSEVNGAALALGGRNASQDDASSRCPSRRLPVSPYLDAFP